MFTPSPAQPLSGQRALVTGGAGGLGLAITAALAGLGADVTYTARNSASLEQARRALDGVAAAGVVCDITDPAGVTALGATGFDILVNNAAVIAPIGRILDLAPEEWAQAIHVNLSAQFAVTRACLPGMIERGAGRVVNISSGAAHRPQEGWSAYCASKAGLAMLTRSLHLEYAAQGLRVFGLAPGVVDTPMQGQIRASGINPVSKLSRSDLAPPQDPARAVAWLCTRDADPLAGQELDVRQAELREAAGLPPLG